MTLEEQIKQKKFNTQLEKAFVNISYTNSILVGQLNKAFKEFNISVQQFNVMRILKGQHPKAVSINDITDRMVDKMSNASRLVEKLRIKDLVKREKCAFDKRQVDVKLTRKGLNMLETLNHKLEYVQNQYSNLTEEEYAQLNDLLDKMRP